MTVLLYHLSFIDYFTCMLRNLTSILICLLYFYKYLSNYWLHSSGKCKLSSIPPQVTTMHECAIWSSKDTIFGDKGGIPGLPHFPLVDSRLLTLKSKCSLPTWNGRISSLRQMALRRRNDAVFFSALLEVQSIICCGTS